jgi:hypothetical protein
MGDGVLLEFASVVAAVECAIAIQKTRGPAESYSARAMTRRARSLAFILSGGSHRPPEACLGFKKTQASANAAFAHVISAPRSHLCN